MPIDDDVWWMDALLAEQGEFPQQLTDQALWRIGWREARDSCSMTELGRLAAAQGFVVLTRQTREAGWQRHDATREVRRNTWWLPAHGVLSPVVVTGDDPQSHRRRHALVASAAVLVRPDHVIAARSAAIVHGLPTMRIPTRPELITREDDSTGRRGPAHVREGLAAHQMANWYGAAVVTPARAVVDAARFGRRDGIMAADAALHDGMVTASDLAAALETVRGFPGVRHARDVLALADGRAESPLESITRLALHDDGFPHVEPQRRIPTAAGTYRVDLVAEEYGLIIECDGMLKYRGNRLAKEKRREGHLRSVGFWVESVTWDDVVHRWPATIRRLRNALQWRRLRSTP